jgi:hypothetical protein
VNSIVEENGRKYGNEEEEEHMNEDMQKFCNFLEAILMMCTL